MITVITTKRVFLVTGIVLFTAYFFIAARTVPRETVLIPRWISSIDSGVIITMPGSSPTVAAADDSGAPAEKIPFRLGDKFGYIDRQGNLLLNRTLSANITLSERYWAEYEAEPDRITVNDSSGGETILIENPQGYPFFLDNRIFIFGVEQNVISEIDTSGSVLWACEFSCLITDIDSAAGLVLAGSLDGIVEVLDAQGKLIFFFEPGGSLYPVITGCAISNDGRRIALVAGIEDQRFLLLERFGVERFGIGDYKVVYHEFLGTGFRRPVYVTFTKDDRWVVFERLGGLGIYEAGARHTNNVFLTGDLYAIDSSGSEDMIFAVVSHNGDEKDLVGVRLPGTIMIEMPFKSADAFIDRIDTRLFVGGGQAIISFDLEKK